MRATGTAARSRARRGGEGVATVTFTNTSSADLDLPLYAIRGGGGLDLGPGAGFGAEPVAAASRAIWVHVSTKSADGQRSFDATWVELGVLSRSRAVVRLAPGGTAKLAVNLVARGFLPGKSYAPARFSVDSPPDPLPAGRYRMTPTLPVDVKGIDWPVLSVDVR